MLRAQSVRYEIEPVPLTKEHFRFSGNCMLQDSDGFMWFGSNDGLYRYDGTNFKIYRSHPDDNNSITDGSVNYIIEDSDGFLWIGTGNGLSRLDRYTESVERYLTEPYNPSGNVRHKIDCLLEDHQGFIWIGTWTGMSRFNKATKSFKDYTISTVDSLDIPSFNHIYRLYLDRAGILWAQNGRDGISNYNNKTDSFELVKGFSCAVKEMMEDRSGRFWITTDCGLYQFDRETKLFQRFLSEPANPNSLNNQMVRAIMEDSHNNIWIRTLDGIYQYNQQLEQLFHWNQPYEYPLSTTSYGLMNYLCEDNVGTIWFFTENGINKIIKSHSYFKIYNPDQGTSTFVESILLDDKDNIYMGTLSGLYHFNTNNNTCTHYKLTNQEYLDRSVNPDGIKAIYRDTRGTIWIGAAEGGLFKLIRKDQNTCQIKRYLSEPGDTNGLFGKKIYHFFEDSQGRLWLGMVDQPPVYYERKNDRIIHLVIDQNLTGFFGDSFICYETSSGDLLAATWKGIYRIMQPFKMVSEHSVVPTEVIQINVLDGNIESKFTKWIRSSFWSSTGTLWLGSPYSGLIKLEERITTDMDQPQFTIKSYTTKNGLPSNRIRSIIEDERGNLWIGTNNGLSKFDCTSETFNNYFLQHGLPGIDFRRFSVARGVDGEIYMGTRLGMISFYPDSLQYNQNIPPVLITNLQINNKSISPEDSTILKRQITYTKTIELNYKQNNLSFEFASMNYIHPFLNQYMYILEGLNNEWIFSGGRNTVNYSNLNPGKYIFRVKGSNNDGIWNEEGASLQITIHPPAWLTWWAYSIYGFIVICIIFLYRQYLLNRAMLRVRIETERIEKEKVKELDHMKSHFFANITHEFRTPLTLLLGPIEDSLKTRRAKIEAERGVFEMMRRNAKRLQRLINQMLDISRLESGKMNVHVSEGDLTGFVRTISSSFLSMAESKNISYHINLQETDSNCFFDPDKVEKILTNLLSNAFKYTTQGGTIKLDLEYKNPSDSQQPEFVILMVEDTGKGISKDQLSKIFNRFYQVGSKDTREDDCMGIGLALTRELVDLLRGTIKVDSEIGKGTAFTVTLPVSESSFSKEERVETPDDRQEDNAVKRETVMAEQPGKASLPEVLIVEDNQDLRSYISQQLMPQYSIVEAVNGREGLNMAVERIPDLIISDLMMPEMGGRGMCIELKADPRTSHIPIIMLTAKADRRSKLEGLETGADDYIIKPFDGEELQVRVKNLINQRKKLREKFRQEFITEPEEQSLISPDDQLLQKILKILYRHIPEPEFNIDKMSGEMNMSRMQMYRKVNAITGHTPKDLLQTIRLKKAATLFDSGVDNVSQVMHQVGFNNQSYFAKCFRKLYKINPSEYLKSKIR